MSFYEAATNLSDLIISGELYDGGMAIQFFSEYIASGETPKMALALTKKMMSENKLIEWAGKQDV